MNNIKRGTTALVLGTIAPIVGSDPFSQSFFFFFVFVLYYYRLFGVSIVCLLLFYTICITFFIVF